MTMGIVIRLAAGRSRPGYDAKPYHRYGPLADSHQSAGHEHPECHHNFEPPQE
jgi:hypothetical protein